MSPPPLRSLMRLAATGSRSTRAVRDYRRYLRHAEGYDRAFFNLTIDFELAWSIARRGSGSTSRAESLERSRRARQNLPALLGLCEEFSVPTTFAVVGHIALSDCSHAPPPFFAPSWISGNWYDVDPHATLATDRDYYGADLVKAIQDSRVAHEIGSHSFSHVDLGDPETPADVARFELTESRRILEEIAGNVSTLVFPKNHPGFLDLVADAGYTIYRGDLDAALERDELGLWRFPLGLWLSPAGLPTRDILGIVGEGIDRRQLVNCYFHLYEFTEPEELEASLRPLFQYLDGRRTEESIEVGTMRSIVNAIAHG